MNLFVIRSETEQASQSTGNKGTPVSQTYENITVGKQDEKEEQQEEEKEEEAGDVDEDVTENEVEGEEDKAEQ